MFFLTIQYKIMLILLVPTNIMHTGVYSEIKDALLVFFVSYGVHNMEIQRVLNLPSSLYTLYKLVVVIGVFWMSYPYD